jgi:hypothetical protein
VLIRRYWGVHRWWLRPVLLTVGPILALVIEAVAMAGLGNVWAGSYDVWRAGGDCGWDGTCSDAGVVTVTVGGFLAMLAAEFIMGTVSGCRVWRRARRAGDTGATAGAQWAALSVMVMLVGAATLAVFLQCGLIGVVAEHWFGTSVTRQAAMAGFYFTWSTGLPAAEIVLGIVAWLTTARWRRRRVSACAGRRTDGRSEQAGAS